MIGRDVEQRPCAGLEQETRVGVPALGAVVGGERNDPDHVADIASIDGCSRRLGCRAEVGVGCRTNNDLARFGLRQRVSCEFGRGRQWFLGVDVLANCGGLL